MCNFALDELFALLSFVNNQFMVFLFSYCGCRDAADLQPHLCMFKGVHDEDRQSQSEDVSQETGVEIRPAVFLQAVKRGGRDEPYFLTPVGETSARSDPGKNVRDGVETACVT